MHKADVERVVTIARPAWDLYRFWRGFEPLAGVFDRILSILPLGSDRFRWKSRTADGMESEWETNIDRDSPGQMISWQASGNEDTSFSGSVHFRIAPGNRGTEVCLRLNYFIQSRRGLIAALLQTGLDPERETRETLRRFKQLMETGVIPDVSVLPIREMAEVR